MNYAFFENEVSQLTIEKLVDKINSKQEDCIVYFSSYGGESEATGYFIDFTKRFPHEITLVSNYTLYSNGFDIFMFSNTKKIIMDDCTGMVHVESIEVNSRDVLKQEPEKVIAQESIESGTIRKKEGYRIIGVSKTNLSKVEKGEDVYFSNTEMKKLAIKAEKHFYNKLTIVT